MSEELTPLQAQQQVMRFAAVRGEGALRLAMHAAVPQVLRPELVHLLRLNFVPESLADTSLEADVLFAPFCDDLGNGYFRFDANARQRLLVHLDPAYEDHATLRSRQVAGFLLTHFDEPGHRVTSSHDPVYEAYLEVERWVALAFLDQEAAAAQLAAVVRDAAVPEALVARFRVAGLTSALSTPLARHHSLLAYAAGVEMRQRGDVSAAREIFESLGDSEIEVAGVRLPAPSTVLRESERRKRESAAQEIRESQAAPETQTVPHAAPGGARFEFHFCCSRADNDQYLKMFFDDLSEEVRSLLGESRGAAVGFFDQTTVEPTALWAETASAVLSMTKSVVAVLSPAFFKNDFCAYELGIFAERLRLVRPTPPLIRPIQWIPVSIPDMPHAFQQINLDFGDPTSTYSAKGLRYLMQQLPRYQSEYYGLVHEIARGIVDSGRQYPLPLLQNPPSLADVAPFWYTFDPQPAAAIPTPPPAAPAAGSVFISYRRRDAGGYAGRLYDYLSASFPPKSIVADVDILPDEDFRSVITRLIESASVVVAIIGPTWLREADDYGKRRIDDADDVVRIEIATAFSAGVPVLPVLVNRATMPPLESLPSDLAKLAYRNAFELRNDAWTDDAQRVAEIIRELQNSSREKEPIPPLSPLRIFISGTGSELSEYRAAARAAVQRLAHEVVMMEDVYPTMAPPLDKSRAAAAECDAMILLLGWSYGYVPAEGNPEGLSITEIEYRTAREHGIPVFAYRAVEGSPASAAGRKMTPEQDQARFLEFVQGPYAVRRFGDASSLAQQIIADLSEWQIRKLSTSKPEAIRAEQERPNLSQSEPALEIRGPVLIFAGHVIDPPTRATPRFPADKEDVAREAIRVRVQQELKRAGRFACAMASASKGADILFHEVCLELGIEARVYLPISVKQFATTFIGRSDGNWLDRFNHLATEERVRTTMRTTRSRHGGETDWQHNAETMFKDAKEIGGRDVTLIVLWDEQQTRSPGAVGDFVKLAKEAGVRVEIIDSRRLFGPYSV